MSAKQFEEKKRKRKRDNNVNLFLVLKDFVSFNMEIETTSKEFGSN